MPTTRLDRELYTLAEGFAVVGLSRSSGYKLLQTARLKREWLGPRQPRLAASELRAFARELIAERDAEHPTAAA